MNKKGHLSKYKALVVWCLMTMILTISCACLAETPKQLKVSLFTDKSAYKNGEEIKATLQVTNISDMPVLDIILVHDPDNSSQLLFYAQQALQTYTERLMPGETIILPFVYRANSGIFPPTSDPFPFVGYFLLLIGSVLAVYVLVTRHRKIKCFLCLLIAFAFIFNCGNYGNTSIAIAEPKKEPYNGDIDFGNVYDVHQNITVDGISAELLGHISCRDYAFYESMFNDDMLEYGELEILLELGLIDMYMREDGQIQSIIGSFTPRKVKTAADAASLLNSASSIFYGIKVDENEVTTSSYEGETGIARTFFTYTPTLSGIPVIGGQIIISTDKEGNVDSLISSFSPDIYSYEPYITQTEDDARDFAILQIMKDASIVNTLLERLPNGYGFDDFKKVIGSYYDIPARLVYLTGITGISDALAYEVSFTVKDEMENTIPSIDSIFYGYAEDYHTFDEMLIFQTTSKKAGRIETRVLKDGLGQEREVKLTRDNDVLSFWDQTRNIQIWTKEKDRKYTVDTFNVDEKNNIKSYNNRAVSGLANFAKAYDFYKELGFRSIDGKRDEMIRVYMDYDENPDYKSNNSYWDRARCAFYFMPSRMTWDFPNPFGSDEILALDTVGHEYTHAVNDKLNALAYVYQSGAINEALADIMGALIEDKNGKDFWRHSEDAGGSRSNCRNMSENITMANILTIKDDTFSVDNDYGNVHDNSRIISHAVYLAMNDSRTKSLDRSDWAEIIFDTMHLLTKTSGFLDFRNDMYAAAKCLRYGKEIQQAILDAFIAVGIESATYARMTVSWNRKVSDIDCHLLGWGDDEICHIFADDPSYAFQDYPESDEDDRVPPIAWTIAMYPSQIHPYPETMYITNHVPTERDLEIVLLLEAKGNLLSQSDPVIKFFYGNESAPFSLELCIVPKADGYFYRHKYYAWGYDSKLKEIEPLVVEELCDKCSRQAPDTYNEWTDLMYIP